MEPGDLVVWDSRTPLYNVNPSEEATQPRSIALYVLHACGRSVAGRAGKQEEGARGDGFRRPLAEFRWHWRSSLQEAEWIVLLSQIQGSEEWQAVVP
jgi:hypothetical protein